MKRGFTLLELLIVIIILCAIALLGLSPNPFDFVSRRSELRRIAKEKSEDNLKVLYTFLSIYEETHGFLPSVQSTNSPRTASADGRDLFPLYVSATSKPPILPREFLKLLQPHGIKLRQFSANPTIDEFDRNHIGYRYNSSLMHLAGTNAPLMWEPVGSSNGMPVIPTRPVFTDGIHVLFTDGAVKWIPADKGGWLATNGIAPADWRMMAE